MTRPKHSAPRELAKTLKSGRFRASLVVEAEAAWHSLGRRRSWAKMTAHALEMFVAQQAARLTNAQAAEMAEQLRAEGVPCEVNRV